MGTAFLGAGAQICINRGLQLEKAGPATSMRFLDIILSYIWQVWILHEKTDGYSIVGAERVSDHDGHEEVVERAQGQTRL